MTARFQAVLDHYGIRSSRIYHGHAHDNGSAEQSHHQSKRAVAQALLLPGNADFADEDTYLSLVREVIERKQKTPRAVWLAEERRHLRPLPSAPIPNYTTYTCVVGRRRTIRVSGRTYSVPSRLIGDTVEVRQAPATIEVRYNVDLLEAMPRVHGRDHRIDCRHVIRSVVRKPGAYAG